MREVKPKVINRYEKPSITEASKPQKKYPNISIDLNTLPEAKKWEVENEYVVTLKLRMTGIRMSKSKDSYDMEYNNNASFDIIGVDVKETNDKKTDKSNKESDSMSEDDSEE